MVWGWPNISWKSPGIARLCRYYLHTINRRAKNDVNLSGTAGRERGELS